MGKYEFEIIKTVASSDNTTFTIFMKSPMSVEEMDNAVRELCDSLNYIVLILYQSIIAITYKLLLVILICCLLQHII